jgi:hypothetical protein
MRHIVLKDLSKKIQRVTSIKHVFLCPRDYWSGGILLYPCPSIRSSHLVCIVCLANSSYSLLKDLSLVADDTGIVSKTLMML